MKCSQIQHDLAIYADGVLTEGEASIVAEHLDSCPVCRGVNAEILEMRSALRGMRAAVAPPYLAARVKAAAASERKAIRRSWLPFPADIRSWIEHSVVPYSIATVASIVLAIGFLLLLNSTGARYTQFAAGPRETGFILAQDRDPWAEPTVDGVSPVAFARTRSNISSESPSINPKGALVALTRSLVRGRMEDDEVVVVADVFSDGLAQIAQVVEPSRDRKVVDELRKAFDSDPELAPFVPTKVENRPDSVRVVLRFQSVNVKTGLKKSGRVRL